ncbi:ANM_HP_G0211550.mRNA.1.CDS.1 [Saccharomyces cerevisiae]|nr:ANM_HP_G0211550.mRNA.1.CDS.1 [Saccharomyces cerevisiae]CAI6971386.1 ANM_HP_G0211550.mRNA.1.CDS.1 [Saccharomyces cerevisiae]
MPRSDFDYNHLVYETRDGTVCQLDAEGQLMEITKFPQLLHLVSQITVSYLLIEFFGFGSHFGELPIPFLLFTTVPTQFTVCCINSTDFQPLPFVEEGGKTRVRAIERGFHF